MLITDFDMKTVEVEEIMLKDWKDCPSGYKDCTGCGYCLGCVYDKDTYKVMVCCNYPEEKE